MLMIRMLFQRLATVVRVLRLFLFSVTEPFMTSQAIELREVNHTMECAAEGEHDEAIAILQRTIASNPSNHILYQLRGLIYVLQSKHDKAIEDFNEAITLDPLDFESHVQRGRVWATLCEYERAVEDFTAAIVGDPNAEAYSARGDAYVEMGKHDAALDDYEGVIAFRPDADAYVARGTAYFGLKRFDNAMNDFNNATLLDPSNTSAYVMRGNIHRAQNNHGRAIDEYTQVITLMPDVVDLDDRDFMSTDIKSHLYELAVQDVGNAYCGRGFSRSRTGDIDGAHSDFSAAIEIMPENASFYWLRAVAYVELGEHAEATKDLEVAVKLDNGSAIPPFIKAWSHFSREEFDEALQDCHTTIGLGPHWAEPYCLRGMVLMRLGDYGDAIHDFGKTIEIGSGNSQTGNERSRGASMTLDLGRSTAYAYRGLAHLLLGHEAMGREDIGKATELGYAQSAIEEEIEALLSDGGDRKAIEDIVKSVVEGARTELTGHLRRTDSKVRNSGRHTESHVATAMPASGKSKTLSREEYASLFRRLGFYDIKVGRTLKHREPIPSIYFNCRYGAVSFVAYAKDEGRYCPDLWNRIPPQKERDAKDNLITIVPRAGKEQDAFKHLLSGDVADRSLDGMQQLQESSMRIMVNDYRGRNPRDTVNGRPISAVIHVANCGHVPHNPGRWWIAFESLEAAQSALGIQAATCVACLEGEGRHLDRVQRA